MEKEFLERIASSKILLDVLIAFEDFLDSNDIYAYKNWLRGEVVAGPIIDRYWVTVLLKYPFGAMPDPLGAQRLMDQDIKVKYKKIGEEFFFKDLSMIDSQNLTGLGFSTKLNLQQTPPPNKIVPLWLVEITMPRRFIEGVIEQDLSDYDDRLDLEDISDAKDADIDAETTIEGGDEPGGEEGGDLDDFGDIEL
jgi:hypothetical protein